MAKRKEIIISDEVRELIGEVARETASHAYIENVGGQVNYYKAMESLLYNYKKLKALVDNEEQYVHTIPASQSGDIVRFSPASTYKSWDDAMDELQQQRQVSYRRTKTRFDEIDRVVQLFIGRKEFHVIRMYYFGEDAAGNEREPDAASYTWEDIAFELSEMGLAKDEKTARRWRSKLVNDMAVCMFGKPAAVGTGIYRTKNA